MIVEDGVQIRIAPGADLSADPESWPWVEVTGMWRKRDSIAITSGRRDEGRSAPPTSCTVTLDARGGELWSRNPLSPWFGRLGVGTPLQVRWAGAGGPAGRFDGLISELPPRRDQSGADSTVTVVANGATRRRGQRPLRSALRRAIAAEPDVVAYWPMEDGEDAASFVSPIDGVSPMFFSGGSVELAQGDVPGGSDSLPSFGTGATLIAPVPNAGDDPAWQVIELFRADDPPATGAERIVLDVFVDAPLVSLVRCLFTDSEFRIEVIDDDGIVINSDTEPLNAGFLGRWLFVSFLINRVSGGSALNFEVSVFDAGTIALLHDLHFVDFIGTGPVRVTSTRHLAGSAPPDRRFGHVAVIKGESPAPRPWDLGGLNGYDGELAADRFERLAAEEGLPAIVVHEPTPPSGGVRIRDDGLNFQESAQSADSLNVAGDLDIRIQFGDVPPLTFVDRVLGLAKKYRVFGSQRSWILSVVVRNSITGIKPVRLRWSPDGAATLFLESTASLPRFSDIALRVTLDVDNGAGGHTARFFAASTVHGPWTQLGDPVSGSGTTSVFASTAPVELGRTADIIGFGGLFHGRILAFELRDGIDGTIAADPDFTAQAVGATAFLDDAGNTWTLENGAAIVRPDTTTRMGPQRPETLPALLDEVETADAGILTGLTYRTRRSLYNQPAALALARGELSRPPEPTDDDQRLRDDVTVERVGGSSARAVRPPGGHSESVQANVAADRLAGRLAEHRLSLGTVDEYRWPKINISLHKHERLIPTWLALRVGDRLAWDHEIPQLAGVDVDLIVEGWSERIGHTAWDVELICAPASPYRVAVFGGSRFDTTRATLAGQFEGGADTSMTVATEGALWTTDPADLPLDVAVSGAVLRVTGIAGAASPQTFTVDRAPVNGVQKIIPAGAPVTPARRSRFGW